jgi:hypothetical protein
MEVQLIFSNPGFQKPTKSYIVVSNAKPERDFFGNEAGG